MHDYLRSLKQFVMPMDVSAQRRQSAYVIGCGLSGLAAAYLLVSETFVQGHHVHMLERESFPGGKYFDEEKKYDSIVLPFVRYLQEKDVRFHYDTDVTNIIFDTDNQARVADRIEINDNGRPDAIDLTDGDLVFSTIGAQIDAKNYAFVGTLPKALIDSLLAKCRTYMCVTG